MSLGSVATVLIVFAVSMIIVDFGTVALSMTGLSRDVARFQALSAFTGTGFTTNESEAAIATPERRRVIATLSRVGSIGVVTAIASLVYSFSQHDISTPFRLGLLALGAILLVVILRSDRFDRLITPPFEYILNRTTDLEIRDYTHLLHLQDGYSIGQIRITEDSSLADHSLADLELMDENIIVIGVMRPDDTYVASPAGDTQIQAGDELVAYGNQDHLNDLSTDRKSLIGLHQFQSGDIHPEDS